MSATVPTELDTVPQKQTVSRKVSFSEVFTKYLLPALDCSSDEYFILEMKTMPGMWASRFVHDCCVLSAGGSQPMSLHEGPDI